MSTKEINNQNKGNINENFKVNSDISIINFTNNNLKKKLLENKTTQIKYSSLSEDEKSFNSNNYYLPYYNENKKINQIINSDTQKDFQNNYNILPINFDNTSSFEIEKIKNNNYKLFFRKIFKDLSLINYNFNEKFKNFSIDIYKNFNSITNEINKIINEINKIYLNIYNTTYNGKHFNFQINNYDLYNNSGIKLNMNNKMKKIKQQNYLSFFKKSKILRKENIEDKPESPHIILNNIEPYLIKKFK